MSPSLFFLGRRSTPSVTELLPQSLVILTATVRRHLPICTVTGTSTPVGTPCNVNVPEASVAAATTYGPMDTSQVVQAFVPGLMAGSAAGSFGMKTTAL